MTRGLPFVVLGLLLAAAPEAQAQRDGPSSEGAVLVGATPYRFTGNDTGTGPSLTVGITIPLDRRTIFLEPSLGFLRITTAFGHRSSYMFPELTVQAQEHIGGLRPYLGVGLGTATAGLSGPAHWKFTMVAMGGARVHLAGRWGVRGEVRLRSVDPFSGRTADFNLGFTHASF